MESDPKTDRRDDPPGDEHNQLEYRNVDEDREHDESGSQGASTEESPQREQ